jgi:hypothetical protein
MFVLRASKEYLDVQLGKKTPARNERQVKRRHKAGWCSADRRNSIYNSRCREYNTSHRMIAMLILRLHGTDYAWPAFDDYSVTSTVWPIGRHIVMHPCHVLNYQDRPAFDDSLYLKS